MNVLIPCYLISMFCLRSLSLIVVIYNVLVGGFLFVNTMSFRFLFIHLLSKALPALTIGLSSIAFVDALRATLL